MPIKKFNSGTQHGKPLGHSTTKVINQKQQRQRGLLEIWCQAMSYSKGQSHYHGLKGRVCNRLTGCQLLLHCKTPQHSRLKKGEEGGAFLVPLWNKKQNFTAC